MNKEIITFGDIEIEKHKFRYSKYPININNVGIDKIIISNKVSFAKKIKYFIGYKNDEKDNTLCTMLPKMSGHTKRFDEAKYMSF